MKDLLKRRIKSDRAASNTVETIIIIALAVFAALALFTFILKPTRDSADTMGTQIGDIIGDLIEGNDVGTP